MKIGGYLALVILFLVFYGWIASTISDHRKKKEASVSSEEKKRDLSSVLQLIAGLIFCALLFYLMVSNIKTLTILLLVPGVVMYTFVTVSAFNTVGSLAMSTGRTPLTEDENSSLLFIGFIVGLIGLSRVEYWNETVANEGNLIQCAVFVLEFSVYFFMIGTLVIKPTKDISKLLIFCASKMREPYKNGLIFIRQRIAPEMRRKAYSEKVLCRQKDARGWRKYIWSALLAFFIPIDILVYFMQCATLIVVWLSLLSLAAIVGILGKYFLGIARWIYSLSNRRVIVISFRVAVVAALLLLVVLNEYGIFITSQRTTSVIEFIASVVIVPIVFEWISSALKPQSDIG